VRVADSDQTYATIELATAPLTGTSLVEASAGTGKTHTIAGIYRRLVAERGLSVDRVLVVTFTEAAAAELKVRLRGALAEDLAALHGTEVPATDLRDEHELRRLRLEAALRSFDDAAIHTIHGFCQRALAEAAFECGGAFETELLVDQEALLREVVDDFWRRECYSVSPLFAAFLEHTRIGPEQLAGELRGQLSKPQAVVRGPECPTGLVDAEGAVVATWSLLRGFRSSELSGVIELLADGRLHAGRYPPDKLTQWSIDLREFLQRDTPGFRLPDKFQYFGRRKIAGALLKRVSSAPDHSLFDAVDAFADALERLQESYRARLGVLRQELLGWARAEMRRRQRERRLRGFDELISALREALRSPAGAELKRALRRRYGAALVDEFQDTDPSQYEIFQRLFADHQTPLYLVGDPKQAIYGFRGADLFAYLRARRQADHRWSLRHNWRSEPGLIDAVNALFQGATRPFALPEIRFASALPGPQPPLTLNEGSGSTAPLRLWLMGLGEQKCLTKETASQRVVAAVAEEVVRLLTLAATGNLRLEATTDNAREAREGRSLNGGDLAILVRTNRQARLVAQALSQRGIASVQLGDESVFDSAQAEQLERLLLALHEPAREGLVRAAVCTELLGVRGAELNAVLDPAGSGFEGHLQDFRRYHAVWRDHGFMPALQELLTRYRVRSRLLASSGGERGLTNLLHLLELAENAARRERLSPAELVRWFAEQRRRGGVSGDDDRALRLETDARLVKVVTVHKSKGLEYPVVFCPFVWDGKAPGQELPAVYHDPREDHQLTMDFGSGEWSMASARVAEESRAEDLRLLYVALTRAKNRCYLAWGWVNHAGHAALTWLLHQPPGCSESVTSQNVVDRYKKLSGRELQADLQRLVERSGGAVALAPLPLPGTGKAPGQAVPLLAATPAPIGIPVQQPWRLASFSALLGSHSSDELPDRDPLLATVRVPGPPAESLGPESFPRGARPGSCLHAILESWDFARDHRGELEAIVSKTLVIYGIDEKWRTPVADWMERVSATALDEDGCRLCDIPITQRRHELEFHYPVLGLRAADLSRILQQHGGPELSPAAERIAALGFELPVGFLRGFVDLIFERDGRYYLADFKSNWLGPSRDDYRPDSLYRSMDEEGYHLQHLLYLLALHRFLRQRIAGYSYQRHIGGVLYLYLRGMDPASGPERGIYRVCPAEDLVHALDNWGNGLEYTG
jgi:exodeoxyribonuclease V beta subunit